MYVLVSAQDLLLILGFQHRLPEASLSLLGVLLALDSLRTLFSIRIPRTPISPYLSLQPVDIPPPIRIRS